MITRSLGIAVMIAMATVVVRRRTRHVDQTRRLERSMTSCGGTDLIGIPKVVKSRLGLSLVIIAVALLASGLCGLIRSIYIPDTGLSSGID